MTLARPRLNSRAELRFALLAAAESCWIYAVVYTIATLVGFTQVVSPLGIVFVYMTGLYVGRLLPRSHRAWRVLQILTVAIAALAILAALRIGLYTDVPIYDASWLGTYFGRTTTMFEHLSTEVISTLALIFTFTRALGFAQQSLSLWMVGFQFRLGIVIFFGAAFLATFSAQVNFILWIFFYFAFSLTSIALARIEEAGQERPLGYKWALVMMVALGLTLLSGFVAAQLLTLETVNAFFVLLSPLWIIVQILITLIAIPLFFILDIILRLLEPVFQLLRAAMSNLFRPMNLQNEQAQLIVNEVTRQLTSIVPYLRWAGVVLVVVLLGWLVARALNRRVKLAEHDWFEREEVDEMEEAAIEAQPPRPTRPRRREIHAENVRRIYAAVLAHAEGLGLTRREAETPLEFLPRLTARFPDASTDLGSITNAYVAVHYAQRESTDAQVQELRGVWRRAKEEMTKDKALDYERRRKMKDGKQ